MVSEMVIERIDVCMQYFVVEDIPVKKYSYLFEVENDISMNRMISKNDAIDFIKGKCGRERNKYSSLSVSRDALNMLSIRDFVGEKIFDKDNERYCGWLFQYDPTPFANWYHECCYYFVISQSCYYPVKSMRGLSENVSMQRCD